MGLSWCALSSLIEIFFNFLDLFLGTSTEGFKTTGLLNSGNKSLIFTSKLAVIYFKTISKISICTRSSNCGAVYVRAILYF